MKKIHLSVILAIVLSVVVIAIGWFTLRIFFERTSLLNTISRFTCPSLLVRKTTPENSFLNSSVLSNLAEESYEIKKKELESAERSYIEANLETMKIYLHGTSSVQEFPILTKGREGSWWETPTGMYSVMSRETNHYSSIGKVWMPWSIQMYGNFFIHGWPYHDDGTPVQKSYSGGCIRLDTNDAKQVYEFAKYGMPILVYEPDMAIQNLPELVMNASTSAPNIQGLSAIVADIDTGEILLNKDIDTAYPVASLTKLMTAVVASELIYLDRSVTIQSWMMKDAIQSFPLQIGTAYKTFDLLYPLLMQSSNGSAHALAGVIGESEFVRQMNEKSKTLYMNQTAFVDSSGVGNGNVSTLRDMARLMKYIQEKRSFIFDITKGKKLSFFSDGTYSEIDNHNEFAKEERLIGMKNGQTQEAGQTMLSLWNMKDSRGNDRRILIGVLKSPQRVEDTSAILSWVRVAFPLQ